MKRNEVDLIEIISALQETSDPIMYQYFKNLNENKLLINSQIDSTAIEMYVMPLRQWDEDPNVEKIHIYVNCVGGSVFDGMAIAETISKLQTSTVVEVLSYAYSMGGYIAVAGAKNPNVKVVCNKFSTFLYHAGSTQLSGDSNAVDDLVDFYREYNDDMEEFMLENTNISKDKLKEMRRVEWYMTSKEMLEYGIVEEII